MDCNGCGGLEEARTITVGKLITLKAREQIYTGFNRREITLDEVQTGAAKNGVFG